MTTTGSIIYLDWLEQYKNPIIVNAQAITMLTKILPLDSMLLRDQYLRILQETSFKYYLKYAETSSIFGSSNSSTGMELKFSISSQSNLNVSYITYVPLSTTFLDGKKINNPKEVFFNFTAEVGGQHEMDVLITHSSFPILFFTQYFYIQKEIGIWTKTAQINIGDTRINDSSTGLFDIPLAASVSIDYSTIKDAIEQSVEGLPILHIRISTNILDPDDFFFEIHITPLKTLERLYSWIEIALQSSWVKILTSLTVVWVILWKQFKLRVLKTLRRCPHCGETGKSKYPICRYCGEIIQTEKSTKKEQEKDFEPPSMESGFQ